MHIRTRSATLAGLLAAACAGTATPPRGHLAEASHLVATIEAEQTAVVRASATVLSEWGFAIASADVDRGLVHTTELVVRDRWRTRSVRDYLYCGMASGTGLEHAASNPVGVSVRIAMRQQDLGATLLRIRVDASVRTRGEGPAQVKTHSCEPTARMANELVADIRAAVTRRGSGSNPTSDPSS